MTVPALIKKLPLPHWVLTGWGIMATGGSCATRLAAQSTGSSRNSKCLLILRIYMLLQHRQHDRGRMCRIVIDPDRRFLKIRSTAGLNVYKSLGIAIDQREPAALHLDHDPVSLFKGMSDLVHVVFYLRCLPRNQRFGLFPAVTKLTPEDLRSDKALIAGIRSGITRNNNAFLLSG